MVVEDKQESASQAPHPILIIGADPKLQRQLQDFSQRLMVPLCFSASLKAAQRHAPRVPLAGAMLSLSPAQDLARAIEQARRLSASKPLPVALIYDDQDDLEEVRALWAGASALVSRPLCEASFRQVTQRLHALKRAQQPRLLVIEETPLFAPIIAKSLQGQLIRVDQEPLRSPLLNRLETLRPDLLLLDLHKNEASILALCRRLRTLRRWQDLPILLFAPQDQSPLRLQAYQAGADDFLSQDLSLVELRARLQVRLHRSHQSRERSDRDSLTGLWTRRAFIEQFDARLSEAKRHRRRLVICLLDLDHFKTVNDLQGHLAGDQVLRQLGELLRDRFRAEDLRGRWGGEEFTIALIDEDAHTARLALQRVLDEFSALSFEPDHSGQIFHVTFSAGVAEFPRDGHDLESLISAADGRLLRAKGSGRQAIFLEGPPL